MKENKVTKTRLIDALHSLGKDAITNSDIQTVIAEIRGTEYQPIGMYCMALYGHQTKTCNDGYWTRPTLGDPRFLRKVGRGQWVIAC